jgi:hypothetical protein
MGRLAGRNMTGMAEPYDYLPFFYSDMFELGYEAVGEVDSRLETFADWKRPNEEGVVYYLWDGRASRRPAVECVGAGASRPCLDRGSWAVHARKSQRALAHQTPCKLN